jgi:hypothetical protein
VVITGLLITAPPGTDAFKVATGRETASGAGVGVESADAIPLRSKEAVTASVKLFQLA